MDSWLNWCEEVGQSAATEELSLASEARASKILTGRTVGSLAALLRAIGKEPTLFCLVQHYSDEVIG